MSRAEELLAALAERGVSVAVQGAQLRFRPRSALSPALIARIVECREELIAAVGAAKLQTRPRAPAPSTAERWLLWTVAAAPGVSRAGLQAQVEHAVAALLERGEIRCRGDGGLVLGAH
jgi:hypothetical protein